MNLKIPKGTFEAYLFDCDGTVADSMPLHYLAWTKALSVWNCSFPERLFYQWGGMPVAEVIASLNLQQHLTMPVEQVGKLKEEYYYEFIDRLQPVPEVLSVIDEVFGEIPFAVVSGSSRESVTRSLSTLGLLDKFEVLICAEDYKHPKPAPEAFLLAAERLQVNPARCLVFEDTEIGIQAAIAAGMQWVKVLQPWEREAQGQALPCS